MCPVLGFKSADSFRFCYCAPSIVSLVVHITRNEPILWIEKRELSSPAKRLGWFDNLHREIENPKLDYFKKYDVT